MLVLVVVFLTTLPVLDASPGIGNFHLEEVSPEKSIAEVRATFDARGEARLRTAALSDPALARVLSVAASVGGGRQLANGCSTERCAALLGNVGTTTVAGTDPYPPYYVFRRGASIAGPFEAGFDAEIDTLLGWLGCSPASMGYLIGGIDTQTSLEAVAYQCGGASFNLPRVDASGNFISLMWSSGVHSPPDTAGCTSPPGGLTGYAACSNPAYHFHQNFSSLYSATAAGHSTQVGVTAPSSSSIAVRGIYGKYEATGVLPTLDACNAHFGTTPDSPTTSIYHHHVTDAPPFAVGCYGPNADGGLVTLAQCRSYYSSCGDDVTPVTTAKGTFNYDLFCPCYNATTGSNVLDGSTITTSGGGGTTSGGGGTSGGTGTTSASVAAASSTSTLTTGAIVGITIGATAFTALAVAAVWALFFKAAVVAGGGGALKATAIGGAAHVTTTAVV